MDERAKFEAERNKTIAQYGTDDAFKSLSQEWLQQSMSRRYVYNFDWLGRPIIQYPQDMVAVQELIWRVRPDVVVETGIAHGGSLVLSASVLAMLDYDDAVTNCETLDPANPKRTVVGVDIDIRAHNRDAIESHCMASRIRMVEGSSIEPDRIAAVKAHIPQGSKVLVFLDSMHTHDHVIAELNAYGTLATQGSYCVVFDTFVENMPEAFFEDRPWDVGNNPMTAVWAFLKGTDDFVVDSTMDDKLQVSVAPNGFLRRVK